MVYPNAGLPNELGAYDEQPATTAGLVGEWADGGQVNIARRLLRLDAGAYHGDRRGGARARRRAQSPAPRCATRLAGLEPFDDGGVNSPSPACGRG